MFYKHHHQSNTMKKAKHLRVVHKNVLACSYKLFSRLSSILLPSEETQSEPEQKQQIEQTDDEEQTIRGKRISAHNLFARNTDDAIKEDGFAVR